MITPKPANISKPARLLPGRASAIVVCGALCALAPTIVSAHPHVFINAKMVIERNDKDEIVAVRHHWKFDELFSASILVDFDDNGDGKITDDELKTVQETILTNIGEFDYFTAFRKGKEIIEVARPKDARAVLNKDNILELTLTVPLEKPVASAGDEFRVSVSDESFYVAFDFTEPDVTIDGGKSQCKNTISVPDYDALNAKNPDAVSAAFSEDSEKPEFSDEYFTWVNVSCS